MDCDNAQGHEGPRVDRRSLLRGTLALAAAPFLPRCELGDTYVTDAEAREYYERRSHVEYKINDPLTGREEHWVEPIEVGTLITISDGSGESVTIQVTQ